LQKQHQQLDSIKQQDNGKSLASIAQAREILDRQHQQLIQAQTLATQALELQQRLQQDAQCLSEVQQNIINANQAIAQLTQQQNLNTSSLDEAKKALALIEASRHKNAIEFRSLLIADQPCPVCGSLEHPCTPVNSALSLAQKNRVDELEQEKAELIKQISQTQKTIEQQQNQVAELTKTIAVANEKILTLTEQWDKLIFTDKPLLSLYDATLLPTLNEQQQTVAADLSHIKQQEKTALDLQQQLTSVQKLLDHTKQALDLLTNDHTALDKQYTGQQAELRAQRAAIENQEKQLHDIVEHASSNIPDCEQLLDWQNPTALAKKVKQYQEARQEHAEITNSLATLTQKIQLITQSCQQYQQQLGLKQTALRLETEQQQRLLLERSEPQQRKRECWGSFLTPTYGRYT
jgi:exonuclease SbcC